MERWHQDVNRLGDLGCSRGSGSNSRRPRACKSASADWPAPVLSCPRGIEWLGRSAQEPPTTRQGATSPQSVRPLQSQLPLSVSVCVLVSPMFLATTRSACATTGVLGRRGFAVESAAARICREGGGRVRTNVLVRDLDLGQNAETACHVEECDTAGSTRPERAHIPRPRERGWEGEIRGACWRSGWQVVVGDLRLPLGSAKSQGPVGATCVAKNSVQCVACCSCGSSQRSPEQGP